MAAASVIRWRDKATTGLWMDGRDGAGVSPERLRGAGQYCACLRGWREGGQEDVSALGNVNECVPALLAHSWNESNAPRRQPNS